VPLSRYVAGFPVPSRLHPFEAALLQLTVSTVAYRQENTDSHGQWQRWEEEREREMLLIDLDFGGVGWQSLCTCSVQHVKLS
jgi:hypothetical protein